MPIDNDSDNTAIVHNPVGGGLVSRSASLAKRGLDSLQTLDRIVRFPSDISIGDVYLIDRSSDIKGWVWGVSNFNHSPRPDIEEIQNVSGDLVVRAGKLLILSVKQASVVPFLSSLAPGALQGLLFRGNFSVRDTLGLVNFDGLKLLESTNMDVDDVLSRLSNNKSLLVLNLSASNATADGLSHLSGLSSLLELDLTYTKIDDKGLSYLSNLTSLTELSLSDTKVTDYGLSNLSRLKSLSYLNLGWTNITDDGLSQLSHLTDLTALLLPYAKITDRGVKYLANLQSLKALDLSGSEITDAGLAEICRLPNLTELGLERTKITDDGLLSLAKLRSLEIVCLAGTNVTDEKISEFKALLPNCEIDTELINYIEPSTDEVERVEKISTNKNRVAEVMQSDLTDAEKREKIAEILGLG